MKKGNFDVVEDKLDRAMVTSDWMDCFPGCQLHNLVVSVSDHSPILLRLQEQERMPFYKRFKFENCWLEEPDIEEVVAFGWNKDVSANLLSKTYHCVADLDK